MEDNHEKERAEIYSQRVRAGKRTYFFDVKATRANDYYLTITESRRRYKDDGFFYEKHKIFLYKEDFNKFTTALQETVGHVKEELMPEYDFNQFDNAEEVGSQDDRSHSASASTNGASSSTTAPDVNVSDTSPVATETEASGNDELKWD